MKKLSASFANLTIANIPRKHCSCTQYLTDCWRQTSPMQGKKILVNCHLTLATLMLIDLLVASGAEVKVTSTSELVVHEPIYSLLVKAGLYISVDSLHTEGYFHYFDIVIDCGAYLADVLQPKIAFIELTHVERARYSRIDCPVVSIDESFIKRIETSFGTGDGFVRAIKALYCEQGEDHRRKAYMVFGFGKVGEGICHCLTSSGVDPQHIHVVEVDENKLLASRKSKFVTFNLSESQESIQYKLLNDIDCAVTATGITGEISRLFSPDEFKNVQYLVNMGTYDEWGAAFSDKRIAYGKKPLNFMLEYPTQIIYLDPVFALLAATALDVIKNPLPHKFAILVPSIDVQEEILAIWLQSHNNINSRITEMWMCEKELANA